MLWYTVHSIVYTCDLILAHIWLLGLCSFINRVLQFYTKCTSQYRKAWAMTSWVHLQQPNSEPSPKPTWGRMYKSWVTRHCNGRPRGVRARMTGLREACRTPNCRRWIHATYTDFKRGPGVSMKRRWKIWGISRPPNLGEAGRPHFADLDDHLGRED